MEEKKIYHYISIMNFGGIDKRVSCQYSLYELPDDQLNKILKGYEIIFKVDEDLFNEIEKLLYEKEELDDVKWNG